MAKQIMKRLVLLAAAAALLCGAAGAVSVEQIQVALPRVDVYVHGDGEDLAALGGGDISADLGGAPLMVEDFQPSEQGIFYIFMLDISKSIPAGHLAAAKQAVRDVCAGLREQDRVALLTFGNEVTVLSGGEAPVDTVLQQLDALSGTDNHTKFYDAMDTLVDMAAQVTDMRRVAVVISDGMDDTDAGMSQAELENVLQQSGIAVYALCIDTAPQSGMDQFRSFIRLSGGELYPYGTQDAETVLSQLLTTLNNVWRLRLLSIQPLTDPNPVPLTVRFGDGETVSAQLEPDYWAADETPPYVTGVTVDWMAKAVTVTFSEPVDGGDDGACYTLETDGGTPTDVVGAAYTGADRCAVRLEVPTLDDGQRYTLTVAGPVDLSEGQNRLISYHAPLVQESAPETTPDGAAEDPAAPGAALDTAADLQRELRNLLLLTAASLAAVVGLVLLIIRSHRGETAAARPGISLPKRAGKGPTRAGKPRGEVKFLFSESEKKDEK